MEAFSRAGAQVATSRRVPVKRRIFHAVNLMVPVLGSFCILAGTMVSAQSGRATTAWKDGGFHIDRKGIVGRSDIILQKPNVEPQQAMPLGNGRLGLAVWAESGYTAQLNRGDTFPLRLSPGQVVVPGLKKIKQSADYSARLNIYDGEFRDSGDDLRGGSTGRDGYLGYRSGAQC